ncbi:hypothetical protein H0H87_003000 [Tephrocybe sp. NHM501043]|nr:hypothetical protein H0H87_003000 [Tephrocybe sp. NHM501043]
MKCIKLSKVTFAAEREAIEITSLLHQKNLLLTLLPKIFLPTQPPSKLPLRSINSTSHTKNKALEAADAARIKQKLAALQKQTKADMITVEATLFYYLKNGVLAKRVLIESTISLTVPFLGLLDLYSAEFGLITSRSTTVNFKPTEDHLSGTVDAMFLVLHSDSKVSDMDSKERRLCLRVYAHELAFGLQQSTPAPLRPRKILSTSNIEFEEIEFDKTTFTIDNAKNLDEVLRPNEKIEISKDWHKFMNGGKAEGGYLSKGATKYAFLVC